MIILHSQSRARLHWRGSLGNWDMAALYGCPDHKDGMQRRPHCEEKEWSMTIRLRFAAALGLAAVALLAGGRPAAAQTQVSTRAALGANDVLDWAVAGPAFGTLTNPFSVTSNGGASVTVSQGAGTFRRMVQDTSSMGSGHWQGNFAAGDSLLWTDTTFGGGTGPMDITFGAAVRGAGTQVMANVSGVFEGTVDAFDDSNNQIFHGTFSGLASNAQDNTAVFVGVTSGAANIKRLRINAGSGDFAVNKLSLVQDTATTVPEPASLALALPGVLPIGLMVLRRRKRSA